MATEKPEIDTKKILKLLEEKIKNSNPGIEIWLNRTQYDLQVRDGEKTFEEWFWKEIEDAD